MRFARFLRGIDCDIATGMAMLISASVVSVAPTETGGVALAVAAFWPRCEAIRSVGGLA
jgi:hypothetical protein